jgi:myo-inositol-1(or 4)-monophosphatase
MALDETDLDSLVAEAAAILVDAARPFVEGHRADSAVQKKGNDFATEVDLAIERQVVEALNTKTGIEVHGEEFGGADVDSPLVWVLDPIDGTFNYAAGSPMAAILLGLVRDGEPVAGLTWVPFTGSVSPPSSVNRCAATASSNLGCKRRSWPLPSSGSARSTSTPVAERRGATGWP